MQKYYSTILRVKVKYLYLTNYPFNLGQVNLLISNVLGVSLRVISSRVTSIILVLS